MRYLIFLLLIWACSANICYGLPGEIDSPIAHQILEKYLQDKRIENRGGWDIKFAYTTKDNGSEEYRYELRYKNNGIHLQGGSATVIKDSGIVSSFGINIPEQNYLNYPLNTKSAKELKEIAQNFIADHFVNLNKGKSITIRYDMGASKKWESNKLTNEVFFNIEEIEERTNYHRFLGFISLGISTGNVIACCLSPQTAMNDHITELRNNYRNKVYQLSKKYFGTEVIIYNEKIDIQGNIYELNGAKVEDNPIFKFFVCKKDDVIKNTESIEELRFKCDKFGAEEISQEASHTLVKEINTYLGKDIDALQDDMNYHGEVSDNFPVWDDQGSTVFFITDREHSGAPWWHRTNALAALTLATKKITYLDPSIGTDRKSENIKFLHYSRLMKNVTYINGSKCFKSINLKDGNSIRIA